MKRYRTEKWNNEITAVEIIRETDKSVWFLRNSWCLDGDGEMVETKAVKTSDNHSWHDTWDDAHAFLLKRAERNIASAKWQLQQAQGEHGNVKGMKKPEDA